MGALPLLLPAGESLRGFIGALSERIDIDPRGSATHDRTFFDTFDGRLHRRNLRLTVDDGAMTLADAFGRERLERRTGRVGGFPDDKS